MNNYGLIGNSLAHSFSKFFFENKFKELKLENHFFHNFELESIINFKSSISKITNLKGLNVTSPFKEEILSFLDEITEEANEIGAVNCIKIRDNRLIGYNTDAIGFSQSIKPFLNSTHERALILGTGGASKAVAYALKKIGIEIHFVTSTLKKSENTFFYSEINERVMKAFKLIINTTPLGMYPNVNQRPILPYQLVNSSHFFYDLIYNPERTMFLESAIKKQGNTMNGFNMLQLQAEKSWEIWNS